MNRIIEQNLAEVRALCQKYHVQKLELFGSAVEQSFDPISSDVDFLVEFPSMDSSTHSNAFFGLLADLKLLFNREVDLLESRMVDNPYFLAAIKPTRKVIFG